jgi:asparagine synthase (glutamine-hydrolysing)
MSTPDGSWLITFNGEIYNFVELRERLASEGTVFRTRSDTEVLLQALARWGLDALPLLDGMFALAAYERSAARLILAVDRFGQKPLAWSLLRDGRLAFASELTALRFHPAVGRELDPVSVCRMLAFDAVPAPGTIWRGVQRLEPGTAVEATLGPEGTVERHRVLTWWQPAFRGESSSPDPDRTLVAALRESVAREMVADVPLGVLLSGGIDSTAVAAVAAAQRSIVTLAMGLGDPAYDESGRAQETARALGTRHVELSLAGPNAAATLEAVMRHLDEPLADAGCLPSWELFRQARQHVVVAVGGDGGDELLEGYPTFRALDVARWMPGRLAGPARCLLRALAALVPVGEGYYPLGYQLRRFLSGVDAEPWYRIQVYVGGCPAPLLADLLRPELLQKAGLEGPVDDMARRLYEPACPPGQRAAWEALDPRDAAVWSHLRGFLSLVLRKVDRMSMAHGLEVRAPMLGSPFAEACLATPSSARRRGGVGKQPLRRWLAASPLAAVTRRPKQGFAIPVARWLRSDLRPVADEVFLDPASPLRDWCRPEALAGLWRQHLSGAADARKELWALMTLGLWLRYHCGPEGAGAPTP